VSNVHCDGPDCGGPLSCNCVCAACNLQSRMRTWATRARSAQIALDLSKDPEDVAIRAGQLLDLAEDIERTMAALEAQS